LWIDRLVCAQRPGGHRIRPHRATRQAITLAPPRVRHRGRGGLRPQVMGRISNYGETGPRREG